nr:MAG TPA: hypothetical protein [Caudoviricetes sp.]
MEGVTPLCNMFNSSEQLKLIKISIFQAGRKSLVIR